MFLLDPFTILSYLVVDKVYLVFISFNEYQLCRFCVLFVDGRGNTSLFSTLFPLVTFYFVVI